MQVRITHSYSLEKGPFSKDIYVGTSPAGTLWDFWRLDDSPGGIAIMAGESFRPDGANITYPVRIDWQIFSGAPCGQSGTWDPTPVAAGSTNILNAAGLAREGLLYQIVGVFPGSWLVRAGMHDAVGTVFRLCSTFVAMPVPVGLCAGGPTITAGSLIG